MGWQNTSNSTYLSGALAGIAGQSATIALWVYPDAGGTRYLTGIVYADLSAQNGLIAMLTDESSNVSRGRTQLQGNGGNSNVAATLDRPVTKTGWSQMVCLCNGTGVGGSTRVVVNGDFANDHVFTNNQDCNWSTNYPGILTVCRARPGLSTNAATGYFAEIAVWDGVLSDDQITDLQTLKPNAIRSGTATLLHYSPLYDVLTATTGTTLTKTGAGGSFETGVHPSLSGGGGSAIVNKISGPFGGPFRKLI